MIMITMVTMFVVTSPTVKGEMELFPFSRKMDISSFTLISRPGFYFEYESELNYAFIDTICNILREKMFVHKGVQICTSQKTVLAPKCPKPEIAWSKFGNQPHFFNQ